MLFLVFGCIQSPPVTASGAVEFPIEDLLFSAEAGACTSESVVVSNGTAASIELTVAEPLDTCGDDPFRSTPSTVSLGAGSTLRVAVEYCPTTSGSCSSVLVLTWADGEITDGAEMGLLGIATSPDEDGDGYRVSDHDCDDARADVSPGADEVEDETDNDCDSVVDEDTSSGDDDGDGYSEREGDCDDTLRVVFPGQLEEINELDDDCDGWVDNHTDAFDDDWDGYAEGDGDCNDLSASVFPLASEFPEGTPNGIDDDCDGAIDETVP